MRTQKVQHGFVWFAALGPALLACGGNVVVDGAASAGHGGAGGSVVMPSPTSTTGPSTSTTGPSTSTGSSTGVCQHCDDYVNNGGAIPLCAGSQPIFDSLQQCACVGTCLTECAANLCTGAAGSAPCFACLMTHCGSELAECNADA